jgi:hypothetical protein
LAKTTISRFCENAIMQTTMQRILNRAWSPGRWLCSPTFDERRRYHTVPSYNSLSCRSPSSADPCSCAAARLRLVSRHKLHGGGKLELDGSCPEIALLLLAYGPRSPATSVPLPAGTPPKKTQRRLSCRSTSTSPPRGAAASRSDVRPERRRQ